MSVDSSLIRVTRTRGTRGRLENAAVPSPREPHAQECGRSFPRCKDGNRPAQECVQATSFAALKTFGAGAAAKHRLAGEGGRGSGFSSGFWTVSGAIFVKSRGLSRPRCARVEQCVLDCEGHVAERAAPAPLRRRIHHRVHNALRWTMTSSFSGAASKSQRASIISRHCSPSWRESTVI
jgi:hypothetical protein